MERRDFSYIFFSEFNFRAISPFLDSALSDQSEREEREEEEREEGEGVGKEGNGEFVTDSLRRERVRNDI